MESDMSVQRDVVWTRPAADSRDSVPIGNGRWGANVWVERNGTIGVLVGANDSWSGNGRLLKVARLRFSVGDPVELDDLTTGLEWSLDSGTATVMVSVRSPRFRWSADLWIDAHHDVLVAEFTTPGSGSVCAWTDPWRCERRSVPDDFELDSFCGQERAFGPVVVEADQVFTTGTTIAAVHVNGPSVVPATIAHQGLEHAREVHDPLVGRVSGVLIGTDGRQSSLDRDEHRTWRLRQSGGAGARYCVSLVTEQCGDATSWARRANQVRDAFVALDMEHARTRHERWWQTCWARSWVRATGSDTADRASAAYRRNQYIVALGGSGPYPLKFNGSVLTMEGGDSERSWDPDYRRWGGPYWFQNTRLMYWGLLAMGSFDSIRPFADLFLRTLPVHRERCRRYWGHGGACFPETLTAWGTFRPNDYGLNRDGVPVEHVANPYVRHYWQGALELSTFLIDWYSYTRSDEVHSRYLVPIIREVLRFYQEHYPSRSPDGTVRIAPAASLETWHTAVDPTPELAGIRFVSDRLDRLGAGDDALRRGWRALAGSLAPIPRRIDTWRKTERILPAHEYNNKANSENPELYTVFPYRLFGVGKPDLEAGRFTYRTREEREVFGWKQDPIHAAMLGLSADAVERMELQLACSNPGNRYPGFWGPNYDWVPDMDHSSVLALTLQRMLLQGEEGEPVFLPAWPQEWDVRFRLFGPDARVIELAYEGGVTTYRTVDRHDRTESSHE